MATTDRYREGLAERLGRVPAHLRAFLAATTAGAPSSATPGPERAFSARLGGTASSSPKVASAPAVLWLHSVSVGEVLAATRLVSELEATHRVVISTTTRTGQHLARNRFGDDRVFYFPFDFAFAIRPYLDLLQPQALLLMESELWPRLLHECATRNIPVVVANARVSDRSFIRSLRLRKLWQRMAQHVTLWLAQSAADAGRLQQLLRRDAKDEMPDAASQDCVISTDTSPISVISTEAKRSGETPVLPAAHVATTVVGPGPQSLSSTAASFEGAGLQSRHMDAPTAGALAPEGLPQGLKPTSHLARATDGLKPVPFKSPPPGSPRLASETRAVNPNIRVTGNLKYDILAPQQSRIATLLREAAGARPILVAGSTTENGADEEQLILNTWKGSVRNDHHALLVLAPRHPERFEKVFALTQRYNSLRATELDAFPRHDMDIIVLNTIGDLASVYSIADIAFVGGSLVQRGGHNPLEPAQFGVPVLMGESYENFRDIVTAMHHADAIFCDLHPETLEAALLDLLTNPADARSLGERGRKVFLQQQGATARTVEAILAHLRTNSRTPSAVTTPMAPASNSPAPSAPTARLIPAWGEAPGTDGINEQKAEGPTHTSRGDAQ